MLTRFILKNLDGPAKPILLGVALAVPFVPATILLIDIVLCLLGCTWRIVTAVLMFRPRFPRLIPRLPRLPKREKPTLQPDPIVALRLRHKRNMLRIDWSDLPEETKEQARAYATQVYEESLKRLLT